MKIEKQIQADHQARLTVEISPEQLDAFKHRAARKISQSSKIAGFRPGKAPYEVVVRSVGESAIKEQAIDIFVDAEYSNILNEAGIKPGAAGTLDPVEDFDQSKFVFNVPLAPEVDLGNYQNLRQAYKWVAPSQKEVDTAIEDLRTMYATTETVDRAVQVGDYVLLDAKSDTETLNRTGFATFIRKEPRDSEWPFPGFGKELVGLKPTENKIVKHKYASDWEIEELQGKKVEIEANVKTVRSVILPDLDDEFAGKTGLGDNMEALRSAVAKDVESRSQADFDDKYFEELIEKIKKSASIKYAPQTLDHEVQHVLEDLGQRLAQQNMDLEAYFKVRNTTREKFIESDVLPVARKRLERSLIMEEIVRREKIEIDNGSLDAEFNATVSTLSMQGVDFNNIRGGNQGKKRVAEALAVESANRLLTKRALEVLKLIATGEYQKVRDKGSNQKTDEAISEAGSEDKGEAKE
ncbi:MAG: trigger factor [Chloroflexi bacterium RBG_16_51_16]|nr:MAG: trigger factor [Chloroflexi bacterium RBG_16_51_16]